MLWRDTHPALHAIILTTAGFLSYSLADACSKFLTAYYSVPQILTYNSALAVIIGVIWLAATGGLSRFITPNWRWHLARGIGLMLTSFFIVHALGHVPLADFYGIVFIAPIAVSVLAGLLLKEPVGVHRFGALIAGFTGVLIIAGPQFDNLNIGLVYTVLSALFIIASLLIMRKIGDRDPLPVYILYPFLCNLALNTPLMLLDHTPVAAEHWWLFVLLPLFLMGGIIGTAFGFARAPVTAIVAPFHYTQMVWGVLIGLIVFSDIPSLPTLVGAGLIIGAGLYVIWREHSVQNAKNMPDLQK